MQHRSYPTRPPTPTPPAAHRHLRPAPGAWHLGRLLPRLWARARPQPRPGGRRTSRAAAPLPHLPTRAARPPSPARLPRGLAHRQRPRRPGGGELMAACDVLYHDPAHAGPGGAWRPCSARGAVWTDPDQSAVRLRKHRRQLAALQPPAWPTASAGAGTAWPSAPPPTPRRLPVREHATSVHLMLDPADASQLDVDARQHPELARHLLPHRRQRALPHRPQRPGRVPAGPGRAPAGRAGRHPGRRRPPRPHQPSGDRARHHGQLAAT